MYFLVSLILDPQIYFTFGHHWIFRSCVFMCIASYALYSYVPSASISHV